VITRSRRYRTNNPKGDLMRISALAFLAISTVLTATPARAQTYDPSYPVCLQVYGQVSYTECYYVSLQQCAATASGRSASCLVNPYFAGGQVDVRRHLRRHG
jgi:hypothetical protein